MDSIRLTDHSDARVGLADMMEHYLSNNEYVQSYVEIEIALLICEIAKRAEDKAEWFPRGKWSMIQAIQGKIEQELAKLVPGN